MNYSFTFNLGKFYFFLLLFFCGWLVSCGLRTSPHNLPEVTPKSTFTNLKVQQRDQRIRLTLTINETERKNALMKFDDDFDQKDYFLIQEQKLKIGCWDCEIEKMPALRILFSSDSFIRQGGNLYYYLELPQNDLEIHQFQVSHFGPEDEILSPAKTVKLKQSNKFPHVPIPNLRIVQIEDEKKIIQFSFGKVVLKKITVVDDEPDKLLEQKKEKAENPETIIQKKQQQIESRTFVLKLSWPILSYKGSKRLKGIGDYFEGQEFFKVHLYRTLSGEAWPENPINVKTISNNHYLDSFKYFLPPATYPHMADTHPDISPPKLLFYIDLHGQKRDTWLYNLRLVDRYGNESASSQTIKFQSPETMILGQNFGQKIFVPLSD